MDFRKPEYRREVFLRFYEFHLKYRSHPGAVYYLIPYIAEEFKMGPEEKFWFCFVNGCSQNAITTYLITKEFPNFKELNVNDLEKYFKSNYKKFGWDTDRRYFKKSFIDSVKSYKENLLGQPQKEFFEQFASTESPERNFQRVWSKVSKDFKFMGRLSTFSYLEYLRIIGLNIDCDDLFFGDASGSKSHRNGMCKVLGRDDLDWHDSNPGFKGYSKKSIHWIETEARLLLQESKDRFKGRDFSKDVSYFTLESALCTFKSWFRPNRRYANVYNDMFHDRIKWAESQWDEDLSLFWEARKAVLPSYLRLEDNADDLGLKPEKQNHFRNTGEVIMMHKDFPCFENAYNASH